MQACQVSDSYSLIDNSEIVVNDDAIHEIHEVIRRDDKKNRRHGVLLGQEPIKKMIVQRRIEERRRRLRRCIHRYFPYSCVECCAMTTVLLTCAVFFVCLSLATHLNNLKLIRSDPTFRFISIATFLAWFVCLGCYAFIVWLHEISSE